MASTPGAFSVKAGRWRLLAAFAILPVAQAVTAFVAFPVVWHLGGHGSFRPVDAAQAARDFALLTGFLGFLVTVAGAVPVVDWLIRRRRVSLGPFLVAGLVLGNAPFILWLVGFVVPATIMRLVDGTLSRHLMPFSELMAGAARAILIGSTFGAISAMVFWIVGVCGLKTDRHP